MHRDINITKKNTQITFLELHTIISDLIFKYLDLQHKCNNLNHEELIEKIDYE